jgi:hypothetical protein
MHKRPRPPEHSGRSVSLPESRPDGRGFLKFLSRVSGRSPNRRCVESTNLMLRTAAWTMLSQTIAASRGKLLGQSAG